MIFKKIINNKYKKKKKNKMNINRIMIKKNIVNKYLKKDSKDLISLKARLVIIIMINLTLSILITVKLYKIFKNKKKKQI